MAVTDARAKQLEIIAQQLVGRLRDDDPEDVGRWLAGEAPRYEDLWQLVFVVAAAVPVARQWTNLTAWTRRTVA